MTDQSPQAPRTVIEGPASSGGAARVLVAPRVTRAGAVVVLIGVFTQATLAGGFLAGRASLRLVHEYGGYALLAVAAAMLIAGLIGRRSRPEALPELGARIVLVVAVSMTVFAGMQAARGRGDLLMLHVPLAFVIVALVAQLLVAGKS